MYVHISHLRIDDENKSAASAEDNLRIERGIERIDLAGKIPDLELHEGAVGDVVTHDLTRTLQKQSLVRRHLMEDDLM